MSWRRAFGGMLEHLLDHSGEVFQPGCRNDNRVAVTSDIFRDAEETPARVLLEGEYESFPFDLDLFRVKGFLVDGRARAGLAGKTTWGPIVWRHNSASPFCSLRLFLSYN